MLNGGEATVLFVDDEPLELELYADFFEGERTVAPLLAGSAEAALDLLRSKPVDCLVSDSIQTRDGESFVTVAKDRYPDLDTILYSGTDRSALPVEKVERYLRKGDRDGSTTLATLAATIGEVTETANRTLEADGEGEEWRVLGNFSWASNADVGSTIVQALADQTDRDILDLPPLYEVIDSDALSRLVRTATQKEREPSVLVQFSYADTLLRISSDGVVTYRPTTVSS